MSSPKTYHRDMLDAISDKKMYPWIRLEPEIFYGKKEYVKDLYNRIKLGKKFYIGDIRSVPDVDFEKVDLNAIRLPFPITVFEFTCKQEDKGIFIRFIIAAREDEDNKIEFSNFVISNRAPNDPDHHVYIPWIFTLHVEDGKPVIHAEEEMAFQEAFEQNKRFLQNQIEQLNHQLEVARSATTDEQKASEEFQKYMVRATMMRSRIQSSYDQLVRENEVPTDFGQVIDVFYSKVVSLLMILNCSNIERVKHTPTPKLNKSRIKKGRHPEDSFFTVTIDRSRTENIFAPSDSPDTVSRSVRMHWRRGHIKRRKTGNYFWSAHVVGRKELGKIDKEYVVNL